MSASSGCPLCGDGAKPPVWQNALCRVLRVDEPDYPGFYRVVLNRHVSEMSELPEGERNALMAVVFAVEAVLRDQLKPDKINLASFGNMVPHLHWHVIPRWRDDRHFPEAIWAKPQRPRLVPPARSADPDDLELALCKALQKL